jgi:hypothetical protein
MILQYPRTNIKKLHVIAWTLVTIGTLLPLAGGARYGMISDLSGQAWCFLTSVSSSDFVL